MGELSDPKFEARGRLATPCYQRNLCGVCTPFSVSDGVGAARICEESSRSSVYRPPPPSPPQTHRRTY